MRLQKQPHICQGTRVLTFTTLCTLCTGFFCLAIIKGPPNDIYFIIEGPCDGYFTEKVSQAQVGYRNGSLFYFLFVV